MDDPTEEILKTIPEVSWIKDDRVREIVVNTLKKYWESIKGAPASKSHHSEDERRPGGLIRHTRRVAHVTKYLCTRRGIDGIDRDIAIAASILHDLGKIFAYGFNEKGEVKKVSELFLAHPSISCAMVVKSNNGGIDDTLMRILKAVKRHYGKWLEWEEQPRDEVDNIVADADYLAVRENIFISIE